MNGVPGIRDHGMLKVLIMGFVSLIMFADEQVGVTNPAPK
jgi:hypothetical protein